MNGHDGNVAFKCTYNDGGDRGFVGFAGTCTDGNILRNVKTHPRRWCSNPANRCRQFCDGGFGGARPQHPCYESQIIDTWRFGPGTYHSEERDGEPIPMNYAQAGKVALLTTRHPARDTEPARIVFGVYKIERVIEDDSGQIWVEGSADHAIRLSETAAFALPYWRFKTRNEGAGSGMGHATVPLSVGSGGEQFSARAETAPEILSRRDGARRAPGMLRELAGGSR